MPGIQHVVYVLEYKIIAHPLLQSVIGYCLSAGAAEIGGQWPPLNLRPLHKIVFFATENQFSLVKQPPLLLVTSSASAYQHN